MSKEDNYVEYNSKLVGVTFDDRQDIIKMLTGDEPLRLRREPNNPHDKTGNATAVDVMIAETWQPIGYIAADKNADIAASMDAGNEPKIAIASLTGGDIAKNGKEKARGVNIVLGYTKAEAKPDAAKESSTANEAVVGKALTPKEKLQLAIDEFAAAQSGEEVEYYSRLLGKTTKVKVINGHVSLPGYLSGSAFPKKYYKPFDQEGILQGIIDKHFANSENQEKVKEAILAMWGLNRDASTGYGTAIHAAMENYDVYHQLGDKTKSVQVLKTKTNNGPNKALSKNPFLKKIVEDFHEKFGGDYIRLNEQFIWTHEKGLCGAIDRVKVIDVEKKIIRIQDFKTDGNIHEPTYQLPESPFRGVGKKALKEGAKQKSNIVEDTLLGLHWLQLSFYAHILTKYYGYTVEGLDVYWLNPEKLCTGENAWEEFSHEVIDISGEV